MYASNPADATYLNNERILEELGCGSGSNPFLPSGGAGNVHHGINDAKLPDETYQYLHKKLADANAIIASHGGRENEMNRKLDNLSRENEDLRNKNSTFKTEIETMMVRQVAADQKVEAEKRAQTLLQERLDNLEKETQEEKTRFKSCFDKLKEAESKLVGSDNLAMKMYSLATDSCAQSDVLREEVGSLETLIDTCKSAMSKLSNEKQELSSKLCVVETEYETYEGTMQDALADIDILKEETLRQENYINDTLNRFREIAVHFDSMKAYVKQQQTKLDGYQKEIETHQAEEVALNKNLKDVECQLESLKKLKETENQCSSQKISELERSLGVMKQNEQPAKIKLDSLERDLQHSKEENIELKSKQTSQKIVMEAEQKLYAELKNMFDAEKLKTDVSQKKIEDCNQKIHQLEMSVSNAAGEKKRMEDHEKEIREDQRNSKETIQKLQADISSMGEEKNLINERLISAQHQLSSIQDQLLGLEKSLVEKTTEQSRLQSEFGIISKIKESMEIELSEKDLKLETVSRACTDKEKSVSSLEEKLNQCQMIFMDNEEKFKVAEKKLKLFQRECDEKQQMNERLTVTMAETQQALENEAREKRQLEETYRDTREEYERHKIQSDNDRSKLVDEMKRVRLLVETESEQQMKEKKANEEAIYKMNEKLKQMADIIDTDRVQIQKLQDRVSFVSAKNEELLQTVSQLSDENSQKSKTLDTVEKEKSKLTNDLDGCKGEVDKLRNELNDANQEYEKFKNEVELFEKIWSKQQKQTLEQLRDELSKSS